MNTYSYFRKAAIFIAILLLSVSLDAKEVLTHFKIDWPAGWQVGDIEKRNNKVGSSYLVKAMKRVDGKPKAVLGVHELPITATDKEFLDEMFEAMVKKKNSLYIKNGYEVKDDKSESFKFKGFNAKKISSKIKSNEQKITEDTMVILTGKQVFAITTVILGKKTKAVDQAIKDALDSLVLQ